MLSNKTEPSFKYSVPDFVVNNMRKWENENTYLSSYDKLSETNVKILLYIVVCNEKLNPSNS